MDDTFAHIDWSKPNAELAVDLKVTCEREFIGYQAWSLLLDDPEAGFYSFCMTPEDAIDEVVCMLYDHYAPGDPKRVAA